MFTKALQLAANFTRPLVISSRTVEGNCRSAIGAYIVLNSDGWILTAGHLLNMIGEQQESARRYRGYRGNVVEFQRDAVADKRFRKKGVRTFEKPAGASIRNHSVWWGVDEVKLVEAKLAQAADLGIGRLEPFDPESIGHYPVVKDPAKDYLPGRSLCKLGFPFHSIQPEYDEERNAFTLPPGSVPLPFFPLEGMFTRIVNTRMPGTGEGDLSPFIETSSPVLVGQMGGPLFDTDGVLWGVLSHTAHHPLGFQPPVPGARRGQTVHQFLNTGLAVHATVIRGLLDSEGVSYQSD